MWITCGLLWCFYQLFGLSFWRHPFTAEDQSVSKWCNAKFLQICSHEETNSSVPWMAWGWVHFQHFWVSGFFKYFYYLLRDVYLGGQSRRLHGRGWLIGLGRWWQIEWGISWPSDVRHRTFLIWVPLLPQEVLHVLHSPKRHSTSTPRKRHKEKYNTHTVRDNIKILGDTNK